MKRGPWRAVKTKAGFPPWRVEERVGRGWREYARSQNADNAEEIARTLNEVVWDSADPPELHEVPA